jgi:Zn-dependent peptidase ImmA (M78 family)
VFELKLEKARAGFCRQMARKAVARCTGSTGGRPGDVALAAGMVLPGFVVVELESLPSGVSAIVDIQDRSIGVNAGLSAPQRRLAIAHEIGHVFLDHPRYVFAPQGRQDAILEREADLFAAEFLVPLAALQAAFRRCRDYEKLAVQFQVEREVMYYRFRDSGLLKQVM